MRVGIVTHEFPPYVFGGIGVFSQNLAKALSRSGIDVLVIAGSPERAPKRSIIDDVKVIQLPRGSFPPRHLWFQLRNVNAIMRELDGCDVIHGQDCASYPLLTHCKRTGMKTPWVITFHTGCHISTRHLFDRHRNLRARFSFVGCSFSKSHETCRPLGRRFRKSPTRAL
jgi:glycosyltransferase involved in cell wall biosynthesis